MTILDGAVIPIGIPPYLIADALARGVSAAQLLSDDPHALLSEYLRAHGHIYPWGHITEVPAGASDSGFVLWRLTALALWYNTDQQRRSSTLTVAALNFCLQDSVRRLLRAVLPDGVLLADANWRFRKRHHLFALLATGDRICDHRRRFGQVLIPQHLPALFRRAEMEIATLCRNVSVRTTENHPQATGGGA